MADSTTTDKNCCIHGIYSNHSIKTSFWFNREIMDYDLNAEIFNHIWRWIPSLNLANLNYYLFLFNSSQVYFSPITANQLDSLKSNQIQLLSVYLFSPALFSSILLSGVTPRAIKPCTIHPTLAHSSPTQQSGPVYSRILFCQFIPSS